MNHNYTWLLMGAVVGYFAVTTVAKIPFMDKVYAAGYNAGC